MDSIALHISVADERQAEILTAELADFPFDGFRTEADCLTACMPQERFAECRGEVDALLARYGVTARCERIAERNWNAAWESGFRPVDVEGRLLIRAPFHAASTEHPKEVVLTPHMAFGTGHHATTWLMARAVLDMGVTGLQGLDMGCGTGVLAIVAAKCGATHMDAADIDEGAVRSCRENTAANNVADRISVLRGDVRCIAGRRYDFILANIHRNILVSNMPEYAAALRPGGALLLSGFLEADVPAVLAASAAAGLEHVVTQTREGWRMVWVRKAEN